MEVRLETTVWISAGVWDVGSELVGEAECGFALLMLYQSRTPGEDEVGLVDIGVVL